MVDTPQPQENSKVSPTDECASETPAVDEESPLLPTAVTGNLTELEGIISGKFNLNLYILLFTNARYVGGIVSSICYAVVSSSFSATLPLHVRHIFHWGSLPTGLLFVAIQGPNAVLGIPVAWLKKRIGTRHPTTIGFAILAIMLWLMGVPGDEQFPWVNSENRDTLLYIGSVAGAGISMSLLNGAGMMEATSE
jgi:Na+/melibiose symporter-like transporter